MNRAALAALFLAGALAWAALLSSEGGLGSGPVRTVEDWPKEFRYYDVLQQALRERRLPLYVSRPILSGRKLLAVPELNCVPHVLLLAWLPVPRFIVLDAVICYAAGFAGALLLRRRYRLGLGPFAFLWLLFFFNGHLVAHMAIGHSMWAAHFLLPFFVLGVLELLEGGERHTRALLALTLFAMLLRGGFHLFAWCVLFLLLLAACNPRRAPEVGRVLAWAAALGAVRLAPAAFLARHREQPFLSGFASAGDLWHALASVRDAAEPLRGGFFGLLGWWEYDTYVGLAGLVWLAVFGVVLARRQQALPGRAERGLYGPACALAALSLGDSYLVLNLSPLPVLNAERVSARLLVLPLVFLATLAALRMQRVAESWPRPGPRARAWSVATAGVGLALSGALLAHGALWRVAHLQQLLPARRGLMNVELAAPPPLVGSELAYVVVLAASAVVSVIALALVLRELRRAYRPISPT